MPPRDSQSLTSSLTPSGHHMRRGGVAANPGHGGIEKRRRLPDQHSLRDMWLREAPAVEAAAQASAGQDATSPDKVKAEKVGPSPAVTAKWDAYLDTTVRRACAEAKLEQLQELCNNLHLQFAKQLDIQEECNNTIATYACPGCGFINLSKTLLPPIGNGLGCGCCYDCPVDVEINYVGN